MAWGSGTVAAGVTTLSPRCCLPEPMSIAYGTAFTTRHPRGYPMVLFIEALSDPYSIGSNGL